MAYREYKSRIGGINHWLFEQEDFKHIISRPFRGEEYATVINGSGAVKGENTFSGCHNPVSLFSLRMPSR